MSTSFRSILDALRPGRTVYVPGSSGEIGGLFGTFAAEPECAEGVRFVGCFVPGMNEFDYAGLHPDARVTTFMLPRAMRGSFAAGRVDLIPATYTGAAEILGAMRCDVAVAHVAPSGADGACSLGICSDFAPLVWPGAACRVLVVNRSMPAMPRGPRFQLADADLVVECDDALVTAPAPTDSAEADRIAAAVAALIPDDAAMQTGIGGAPGAVWAHLRDRRGLVLRSGMATEPLRALAEAGALAAGGHCAGVAYGGADFYAWLAESDLVEFATTRETHHPAALADIPRFHAINSALEVDLFGQVNVEWQAGRIGSGVGGGPNFTRAALASPGGRSIIALPSTAKRATVSRIVPVLTAPAVGMPRTDIDTVVTEHGVAEVRAAGLDARAEALIAIADPRFRPDLARAWAALRATF